MHFAFRNKHASFAAVDCPSDLDTVQICLRFGITRRRTHTQGMTAEIYRLMLSVIFDFSRQIYAQLKSVRRRYVRKETAYEARYGSKGINNHADRSADFVVAVVLTIL